MARWLKAAGFAFTLAVAGSAWADEAPPEKSPVESVKKQDAGKVGHARRPIFLGLLAAGFLLVAGLAGANDRPS